MAVTEEGSNIVVNKSVAGSVFPTSEREIVFPVLVDGTVTPVHIEGALYGRSIELRGSVRVDGPVLSRGDLRIKPQGGLVQLNGGLTVNGSVNASASGVGSASTVIDDVSNASVIIRGDVAVNQNIALHNAVVFGSVRAVNCHLDQSLVLGTCIVEENLRVAQSSIGGYTARDVQYEGPCIMLHALGESYTRPLFLPREDLNGAVLPCDIRFYPAVRDNGGLFNRIHRQGVVYPDYSVLDEGSDWVPADVSGNPAFQETEGDITRKWVLSIGGRIGDMSVVAEAVARMTAMLRCGFEYEHYAPGKRDLYLQKALRGLTREESWVLATVCPGDAS